MADSWRLIAFEGDNGMNWKTTVALLILVAAGGVLAWYGPQLPSWLDPAPKPPPAADAGTRAELEKLDTARLTHIEMRRGDRVTVLQRKGGAWTMPGNWPTRTAEAEALADRLAGLRTRFDPEPISGEADLDKYGLRPPALTVEVRTTNKTYRLAFGERPQGETNRFEQPTWLRLDDRPEVVRLAPGLIAQLDRPTDYYQQRRLFPGERVVKDADPNEKVERLAARAVTIEDKKDGNKPIGLVRTRDGGWELSQPVRDRLDPRLRDALLTAVPDVWAEQFVHQDTGAAAALAAAGAGADPWTAAIACYWATPQGLVVKSGLNEPERVLTVTRPDGEPVTLLVGRTSGSRARKVVRPAPPGPAGFGQREREETVFDEYRYARLKGNDQVFEVKADKLRDVFVPLDGLREAQVAPFSSFDARRVEIVQDGQKIVLAKEGERWKLVEPVQADADGTKVTDLLGKLSGLQARDKDVIDHEDPKKYGIDKGSPVVTVTVEEETKEKDSKGEKVKKKREITVRLGKHDAAAKKLYVQADDWPRIDAVDDGLDALVRRPALAYRGKRVFDFATSDLAKLEVRRGADAYVLEHTKDGWRLASPVTADADAGKVDQLAGSLSNLEVVEYVNDAPKADQLETQYGLGKPALVVRLEFTDKAKPAQTLQVGKARGIKPGYFARLAGAPDKTAPVFVIPNDVHTSLDRDALAYRPGQLWQVPADDVTAVRIQRGKEEDYTLRRDGAGWKITGPFEAPALALAVQSLAAEVASPQVQSYKAHEAKDLAPFGLDKPTLRIGVTGKDGKAHMLLVGGPAEKDTPGRYAKVADGPAVFVVNDSLARAADHAALDLLDSVLLHLDPAKVERVRRKEGDTAFTLERKGDGWRVTEAPGSPFTADAEVVAGLERLWPDLHAERFAAYGPRVDWARYGLDKPPITVTVTTKAEGDKPAEHTIELSVMPVADGSGARYARVDRGAGVAVLDAATGRTLAQTALDYVNRNVLKFDAAAAQSLQRQAGPEVLEVVKKDDGWRLLKPVEERADDKAVQDLLAQIGNLRALRIAAYPLKELPPFGLDSPAAVVTIKLTGNGKPAEHVIRVGKVADGTDRFAQVDGQPVAAVLPAALAERLLAGPLAFRDRNLARFADADKARLERGPRQAVFARVDGTWKLTEPLQGDADQDQLDDFINSLAKLRADALVAEKPGPEELKKYGLDRPEARWRLESGDKEVLNLLVGNAEENGLRRYARLANRDLVFLLDPRLSGKVLAEYRPRAVWSPPLDAVQVDSLRYNWALHPFVLEKSEGGTWRAAGKPEAKVNTEAVNDALAALAGLKVARYVVDKGADPKLFGLDKPDLVLEVVTRNGRRLLEVGGFEGGSKRRYARVPGPDRSDVFLLEEYDCARILRDLPGFTRAPVLGPAVPAPEK
jgi:hypothetical protein